MLNFVDLENINWFWLVIACLAAWRLTNILFWEEIAVFIRKLFGGYVSIEKDEDGVVHETFKYRPLRILGKDVEFFAKLWSCFWCLSVWVSIGVTVIVLVFPYLLLPFAISAVAIIVEKNWD